MVEPENNHWLSSLYGAVGKQATIKPHFKAEAAPEMCDAAAGQPELCAGDPTSPRRVLGPVPSPRAPDRTPPARDPAPEHVPEAPDWSVSLPTICEADEDDRSCSPREPRSPRSPRKEQGQTGGPAAVVRRISSPAVNSADGPASPGKPPPVVRRQTAPALESVLDGSSGAGLDCRQVSVQVLLSPGISRLDVRGPTSLVKCKSEPAIIPGAVRLDG